MINDANFRTTQLFAEQENDRTREGGWEKGQIKGQRWERGGGEKGKIDGQNQRGREER